MKCLPRLPALLLLLTACIGDDIVFDTVDPVIRIMNPVDTLALDTDYQFAFAYLDNTGRKDSSVSATWSSTAPDIISITDEGLASAHRIGSAAISVQLNDGSAVLSDTHEVVVGETTAVAQTGRSGTIKTSSSYELTGNFVITGNGNGGITLSFSESYRASTALPGLYVYLTNNPNTIANALEIGMVEVFSGSHSYQINNAGLNSYSHVLYFCKPFNVKVGDGTIN